MGNIHDLIKKNLPQIKESANEIKEIAKREIEQLKEETEKIKELAERDKKRFLKNIYNENKENESIQN